MLQGEAIQATRAQIARAKIWSTTKEVVRVDGVRGLWRGTVPTLYRCVHPVEGAKSAKLTLFNCRNVPGVSLYFLSLSRLRDFVGRASFFRPKGAPTTAPGGKIKLTPIGDLLVGSTARTAVGFVLTPFTLLKTISEVRAHGRCRAQVHILTFAPAVHTIHSLDRRGIAAIHLYCASDTLLDWRPAIIVARSRPDSTTRCPRRRPFHRLLRARSTDTRCKRRQRKGCCRRWPGRCVPIAS